MALGSVIFFRCATQFFFTGPVMSHLSESTPETDAVDAEHDRAHRAGYATAPSSPLYSHGLAHNNPADSPVYAPTSPMYDPSSQLASPAAAAASPTYHVLASPARNPKLWASLQQALVNRSDAAALISILDEIDAASADAIGAPSDDHSPQWEPMVLRQDTTNYHEMCPLSLAVITNVENGVLLRIMNNAKLPVFRTCVAMRHALLTRTEWTDLAAIVMCSRLNVYGGATTPDEVWAHAERVPLVATVLLRSENLGTAVMALCPHRVEDFSLIAAVCVTGLVAAILKPCPPSVERLLAFMKRSGIASLLDTKELAWVLRWIADMDAGDMLKLFCDEEHFAELRLGVVARAVEVGATDTLALFRGTAASITGGTLDVDLKPHAPVRPPDVLAELRAHGAPTWQEPARPQGKMNKRVRVHE